MTSKFKEFSVALYTWEEVDEYSSYAFYIFAPNGDFVASVDNPVDAQRIVDELNKLLTKEQQQ